MFALLPAGKLEEGWTNLHLLLWKQFIALLVRIELEGESFGTDKVWAPAWGRFEEKVLALKTGVENVKRRAESRGEEPPDLSKRGRAIEPIASFTIDGDLTWNREIVRKLKELAKPKATKGRGR